MHPGASLESENAAVRNATDCDGLRTRGQAMREVARGRVGFVEIAHGLSGLTMPVKLSLPISLKGLYFDLRIEEIEGMDGRLQNNATTSRAGIC